MSEPGAVTIRSFRVAFELERRLFKVDRWRLPVPHGVPLRSLAYAAATLIAVLALGRLPLAGDVIALLPPPLRFAILPGGAAYALTQVAVDGRPVHRAALAWLGAFVTPRRLVAFRPCRAGERATIDAITFWPDEHSARYRRGVVHGPACVLLRYPVVAAPDGRTLRLTQRSSQPMWRGKEIALRAGQRIAFR